MIFIKYAIFALADLLMLPVWFIAAPFYSAFTDNGWPKCGAWLQTYDNPPEGDDRHIRTYGIGYYQRVLWLWRNPGYGFQKMLGVKHSRELYIRSRGKGGNGYNTSDKYGLAGWYYADCRDISDRLVAFELYAVIPWPAYGKCLRVRIGWKIITDKFEALGFAPLVNTVNPFKSYGV
jgi:hypothetical protein